MRALIFGEDHEATLRDQIEDAIDEADAEPLKRGDLNPVERQMLRNLLHFGDRTVGEVAVTRGDIVVGAGDDQLRHPRRGIRRGRA